MTDSQVFVVSGVVSPCSTQLIVWADAAQPHTFARLSFEEGSVVAKLHPKEALNRSQWLVHGNAKDQEMQGVVVSEALYKISKGNPSMQIDRIIPSRHVLRARRVVVLTKTKPLECWGLQLATPVAVGYQVFVDAFAETIGTVNEVIFDGDDSIQQEGSVALVTQKTKLTLVHAPESTVLHSRKDTLARLEAQLGTFVRPVAAQILDWLEIVAEGHGKALGKGLLLSGASGCGKSTLVKEIGLVLGLPLWTITPEQLSKPIKGQAEAYLLDLFKLKIGTRIIVLDQVDRVDLGSGVGKLLVALIDASQSVIIIGLTSALDEVPNDFLLLRRFGEIVTMRAPVGVQERLDLVQKLVNTNALLNLSENVAVEIAKRTNAFLPSEIQAVVRDMSTETDLDEKALQTIVRRVGAASLRFHGGGAFVASGVKDFDEVVAGLQRAKEELTSAILLPLRHPERLKKLGLRGGPRGVLLHGPSGNGKTLLARTLASLLDREGLANMICVQCPELVSKVVGSSESKIAALFRRARLAAPCVVFLDQIDAVTLRRGQDSTSENSMDRMLSSLLVEMDGVGTKSHDRGAVVVLGATDRKDALDAAILRPGRFDFLVHVGPPKTRAEATAVIQKVLSRATTLRPAQRQQMADAVLGEVWESQRSSVSAAVLKSHAENLLMRHLRASSPADA